MGGRGKAREREKKNTAFATNKILPSKEYYTYSNNMHPQCNYISKAITTVHISSRLYANALNLGVSDKFYKHQF